jgi:ribosomal protein L15
LLASIHAMLLWIFGECRHGRRGGRGNIGNRSHRQEGADSLGCYRTKLENQN